MFKFYIVNLKFYNSELIQVNHKFKIRQRLEEQRLNKLMMYWISWNCERNNELKDNKYSDLFPLGKLLHIY